MSFKAKVALTPTVTARDEIGRFINLCEAAGVSTLDELADLGMRQARIQAPKGKKRDRRTPKLVDSLFKLVGLNTVRWGSTARHALPQETGSVPHDIPGSVRFWWEREGRMWRPGDNTIRHPGNPATHWLSQSYEYVMANALRVARKHYPN